MEALLVHKSRKKKIEKKNHVIFKLSVPYFFACAAAADDFEKLFFYFEHKNDSLIIVFEWPLAIQRQKGEILGIWK